ncbi:MAG: lactonase family protein [Bacteroidales bacterium]|nr:lactonase family protein [Bacteroidales bacterium]MDT8431997.1 lactonase family protein [Bacteroidales bacterium]
MASIAMTSLSAQQGTPFYVGTYTGEESQGIYKYLLHNDGTLDSTGLAAVTPNPSFVARSADGQYLLAISEVSSKDDVGFVKSYRIMEDSLVFISESTSGGAHPCFITVHSEGDVLVANYTGGNVALLKMNRQGGLSDLLDLQQHEGSSITGRQKGPHAHSAWFDPVNDNVIAVDLGTDDLWISKIDRSNQKLIPVTQHKLAMPPGAGPRHLDFHPNGKWIYVVNELDCTVSLVEREGSGYRLGPSFSTLPEDFEGKNTCAHVMVSADGKYVYASNRGHNSIAVFSVNKKSGELSPAGHQSVNGRTPRNFNLSPGNQYLVVANQDSNNIVSFKRNRKTGQLTPVDEINAPKPVCIEF